MVLSQEMTKAGIPSVWMSGATKVAQRLELFKKLESGEIRCIVSVETISEGLDIPEANTCIFAEPRTSPSRITQCVGRVLRKSIGKTVAHVVVPAMHSQALRIVLNRLVSSTPRLREAFKNETEGRISFIASSTCDEDTANQCELQQLNIYTSLGQLLDEEPATTKVSCAQQTSAEAKPIPPRPAPRPRSKPVARSPNKVDIELGELYTDLILEGHEPPQSLLAAVYRDCNAPPLTPEEAEQARADARSIMA
jgi:superfamily II DNA/RNA helicase